MVQSRGIGTESSAKLDELAKTGIPVINFSPYFIGGEAGKSIVIQAVKSALDRFGFFGVIGMNEHVDVELFQKAYVMLETALTLPLDIFMKYVDEPGKYQHGMAPPGSETAIPTEDNPNPRFDPKWYMQLFRDTPAESLPEEEVPGITETFRKLFDKCEELGEFFHSIFAQAYGLPVNFFEEMLKGGNTLVRGIRYPVGARDVGEEIARVHTDVNACTLLFTARGKGLYVVDPNTGEEIFINVPEGVIIVNTGDQFALLMGTLAGKHGVRQQLATKDRYTIVAFIHYNDEVTLLTLKKLFDRLVKRGVLPAGYLATMPFFKNIEWGEGLIKVYDFFWMRISGISTDEGLYEKLDKWENAYTIGEFHDDLLAMGVSEDKLKKEPLFHSFGKSERRFPLCQRTW